MSSPTPSPLTDPLMLDSDLPPCPADGKNILNRMTYWWVSPLIKRGYKTPLKRDDLYQLPDNMQTDKHFYKLRDAWLKHRHRRYSLFYALFDAFKWRYLASMAVAKLVLIILNFVKPIVLYYLLNAPIVPPADLGSVSFFAGYGAYILAAVLTIVALVQAVIQHWFYWQGVQYALTVRGSLLTLLQEKLLLLHSSVKHRHYSSGVVMNLASVDVDCVMSFLWASYQELWASPLVILVSMVWLFFLLGWSAVVGIAILCISIGLNAGWGSKEAAQLQRRVMEGSDKRIHLVSEFLGNIKLLKLYAWEKYYAQRIHEARHAQNVMLSELNKYSSISRFIGFVTPFLVALGSFSVYVFVAKEKLDTATVFTAILLFNLMKEPLGKLPEATNLLIRVNISHKRLKKFLMSEEYDPWWDPNAESPFAHQGVPHQNSEKAGAKDDKDSSLDSKAKRRSGFESLPKSPEASSSLPSNSVSTSAGTSSVVKSLPKTTTAIDYFSDAKKEPKQFSKQDTIMSMKNCYFGWSPSRSPTVDDESNLLHDISLNIGRGQLVFIIGPVGCGKSTLMQSMLRETFLNSGQFEIGQVDTFSKAHASAQVAGDHYHHAAFSSSGKNLKPLDSFQPGKRPVRFVHTTQQSWLQSDTLRNNILFGKPFEANRYAKAIASCALIRDLEVLRDGDESMLGEKGVNLSGGQKQRLALSRAVYARDDADCFLLDEPLSALDAHVAKMVFDDVLGPRGVLRKKTRVMITHRVVFAPEADWIILLKDGRIGFQGSYNDLMDAGIDINTFAKRSQKPAVMRHTSQVDELSRTARLFTDLKKSLSAIAPEAHDNAKAIPLLIRAASRLNETLGTHQSPLSAIPATSLNSQTSLSGPEEPGMLSAAPPELIRAMSKTIALAIGADSEQTAESAVVAVDIARPKPSISAANPLEKQDATSTHGLMSSVDQTSAEHLSKENSAPLKSPSAVSDAVLRAQPNTLGERSGSIIANLDELMSKILRRPSDKGAAAFSEGGATDDRITKTGAVDTEVYIRYFFSGANIWFYIAVAVVILVSQTLSVGSDTILAQWCNAVVAADNVPAGGSSVGLFSAIQGYWSSSQYVVFYASCIALGGLFFLMRSFFVAVSTWKSAISMHDQLFEGLSKTHQQFFDATPLGRIISRCTRDQDAIDRDLPGVIQDVISCSVAVLGTIILISALSPAIIPIIIPIMVLYYYTQKYYLPSSRELKRLESSARSPMYSFIGETYAGLTVIRAFDGTAPLFQKQLMAKINHNTMFYFYAFAVNRWLGVRLEVVGALLVLAASVGALAWTQFFANGAGQAWVALAITTTLSISGNLNWMVRQLSDMEIQMNACERVAEYSDLPPEEPDFTKNKLNETWKLNFPCFRPRREKKRLSVEEGNSLIVQNTAIAVVPPNWPSTGTLEACNFTVRYRTDLPPVLKSVSFSIRSGEKIGVVGRTGSGKTTLSLSIFRIVDTKSGGEGCIKIDGVDISTLPLQKLRSSISIIPQEPVLFTGTLRYNLDPGAEKTDDELWNILEKIHLKEFVKVLLPQGLDSMIENNGDNMSAGQQQLLCLGRVMVQQNRILVMDEATSSIDVEMDRLIQKTIRQEFKEKTIITIAHRLDTILDSDRIMVFDSGRLVEFDSPGVLASNPNGFLAGLLRADAECKLPE